MAVILRSENLFDIFVSNIYQPSLKGHDLSSAQICFAACVLRPYWLVRLFCCRNLHHSELYGDNPKASTQGTVEQSRMQTGSRQTSVASIPDVYGRVRVWEGAAVLVFAAQLENLSFTYGFQLLRGVSEFHTTNVSIMLTVKQYFHSYINCILTTIHPYGNLNSTTQCLVVS